ncbi:glycoside hydrolase family 78 protein [Olivibacter sp. CPCC 100613]|uniref:glycoside hydrolase family 78 protein n=1 Tax=Olivibacter sp. CPCC 100613 TaxID=3079931 RepID=UPI002FF90B65
MRNKVLVAFLFYTVWAVSAMAKVTDVQLSGLRCESLVNPLGIDQRVPRLSWQLKGGKRGLMQRAYQIQVASSLDLLKQGYADRWDSGKISSDSSIQVAYKGKNLHSGDACYWRVKIWTNDGQTIWSEPAYWTIGLLKYTDWKGRWIGLDRSFDWDQEDQFSRLSARYFRKEFQSKKKVKRAIAYIMGLGLYELYINGEKVGKQVLAPAPTDYTKEVKYNTFDVTAQLKQNGKQALGVILGNGRFYTMRQAYKPYKIKTFGYPKMRLNLDIWYADGTRETISTDDSWKVTADGPIRTNNEYDGEEYDARKELPGWNQVGYDDQDWLKASFVQEPGGMPRAQFNEPMQVMDTLRPKTIHPLDNKTYIVDMGQNMTGWLKIRVKGASGTAVKMRFAESLQADGNLFVANLRDAKVTDHYILRGEGTEYWEPRFVYHGFRYVELTGYPGEPTLDDLQGMVVYDALANTGTFTSSQSTLNAIYHNAWWGIAGNYKGMPIDCPQRNERQPWLGDRTTGCYGESFLFDNAKLYAKWLDDIQGAQMPDGSIPDVAPAFWRYYSDNVTWPGTYLTVADMLYQQYGDVYAIRKHYPSMKRWMQYMWDNYEDNGLLTKDKYGDWCVPPESKELIHAKDPLRQTEGTLLASATYYHLTRLMERFADIVGDEVDRQYFESRAAGIKEAFNKKFLAKNVGQYSNNTVTANLLPLYFNLVPDEYRKQVFENMLSKITKENQHHISTGVIGTQYLMRGLSNNGRSDLAFQLATNTTYPSWGYMVEKGATTIWELWNGDTANPSMNSQNHVMLLGDLLIWYYENLVGIKANKPGFKQILMKPDFLLPLTKIEGSYRSPYGLIKSSWRKENDHLRWDIEIPANTTACIYFPTMDKGRIRENEQKIASSESFRYMKNENGHCVFEVGAGTYQFSVDLVE